MAGFPYVKKGDPFKPNLDLENAVRRMVNRQDGFSPGKVSGISRNNTSVAVYNPTMETIPAGSAVAFDHTKPMVDDAIPCRLAGYHYLADELDVWGILADDLEPNAIGSCIISGTVTVNVEKKGVNSSLAPGTFTTTGSLTPGQLQENGMGAPILFQTEKSAVINLDGGAYNRRIYVSFINLADKTIGQFTAVSLYSQGDTSTPTQLERRHKGIFILNGMSAYDDSYVWGISLSEVKHLERGTAIVSGIAPAWFTGNGKSVTPTNIGLEAGDSGSARVLIPPEEYDGKTYPGMILLGGSSASEKSYHGPFKLQALSKTEVEVFNSLFPDSDSCGQSDVPGCEDVPRLSLTLPKPNVRYPVFLSFKLEDSGSYSAHLSTDPVSELYHLLGYFSGGSIVQSYQNTGIMIFGNQWYLHINDRTH